MTNKEKELDWYEWMVKYGMKKGYISPEVKRIMDAIAERRNKQKGKYE